MQARNEKEIQKIRIARSASYELAALVRVAFHDPKAFPKYEKFIGDKKQAKQSPDDLHAYLMALSRQKATPPKTKG